MVRAKGRISAGVSQACKNADLHALRKMHLSGENVQGYDPQGDYTALHISAANGHLELVRYLVDHAEVSRLVCTRQQICAACVCVRHVQIVVITSHPVGVDWKNQSDMYHVGIEFETS